MLAHLEDLVGKGVVACRWRTQPVGNLPPGLNLFGRHHRQGFHLLVEALEEVRDAPGIVAEIMVAVARRGAHVDLGVADPVAQADRHIGCEPEDQRCGLPSRSSRRSPPCADRAGAWAASHCRGRCCAPPPAPYRARGRSGRPVNLRVILPLGRDRGRADGCHRAFINPERVAGPHGPAPAGWRDRWRCRKGPGWLIHHRRPPQTAHQGDKRHHGRGEGTADAPFRPTCQSLASAAQETTSPASATDATKRQDDEKGRACRPVRNDDPDPPR